MSITRFAMMLSVVGAFVLVPCVSRAQLPTEATPHRISVSGEAQVNVVPDKVQITLGVETSEATLAEAKSANDAAAARVLSVTRDFKVDPKDVQTDYISIEPDYSDSNGRRILHPTRYVVRKSMVVTLREVSRFDAFLSAAVDSGANVVLNIQFLTSDLRKYRDQAREAAMKAARQKADLLAGALGQKTGKAVNIEEYPTNFASSYGSGWGRALAGGMAQNMMSNAASDSAELVGDTTAPGQTQVKATVHVVFDLE